MSLKIKKNTIYISFFISIEWSHHRKITFLLSPLKILVNLGSIPIHAGMEAEELVGMGVLFVVRLVD